jgi:Asp-tRNA(Asn)/Glu-tRNA(Gln) amidotransferase A subunit family amidase
LQILFRVMAGPDDGDPHSVPLRDASLTGEQIRKVKVGWFEDDGSTPVTDETREAVRQAADCLREEGFQASPFRPAGLERARQLWWDVFGRAGAFLLAAMTRGREAELSPLLKEFFTLVSADAPLTLSDLMNVWVEQDRLRACWLSETRQFPVLLCPVCSVPAFRHGEREWMIGSKCVKYLDVMTYSQWFNILGLPAAVVPVGWSAEGLPIGIQVVGRPYQEEVVLAIAAIIERCGGCRRPPI